MQTIHQLNSVDWSRRDDATLDALGPVAVVHEWLPTRAGSEQVFEAMAQTVPDADLYALSRHPEVDFAVGGRPIQTTALDRIMARKGGSASTLPLMPAAWQSMRTRDYDLVLTSAHAFVRAFPAARDAVHLSYTHTPMRYVWTPELDSRNVAVPLPVRRSFQRLDLRFARTVDAFAANSTTVRDRIRRFYERDAVVIPPPVDTDFFDLDLDVARGDHVLSVSRLVPYKRHDLAIEAAALAGVPIVVAGRGPDEPRLRALADRVHPGGVRFEIGPDRARLRRLFQEAAALVFPALEDFGIVPVEAQACGTPVVALAEGGSLDTVDDGVTGLLAPAQTVVDFRDAIRALMSSPPSPMVCRLHAEAFSRNRFGDRLVRWVASHSDAVRPATAHTPAMAGDR